MPKKSPQASSKFTQIPVMATVVGVGAILTLLSLTLFFQPQKIAEKHIPTQTTALINQKPLFEQIQQTGFQDAIISEEPTVIKRETIPANWKTTTEGEKYGFELRYPPEWSNSGGASFCMKPQNGSCSDYYPYYFELTKVYEQEKTFLEHIGWTLSFESRRDEKIGFKYEKVFSKLEFDNFDGVVQYSRKSTEPDLLYAELVYIKMNNVVKVFGINLDDPIQRKVFSSLRAL